MESAQIFDAIDQQDAERLDAILSAGADPNSLLGRAPYWRPLEAAIEEMAWYDGSIELVRLLIRHGADVNARDGEDRGTPLHAAMSLLDADLQVEDGPAVQRELVQLLLEAGADPNVVRSTGESPLRSAVERGDVETARLLLRFGASATLDEHGAPCGDTALTAAARRLDLPMIELLIQGGADPSAVDEGGRTAIERLPPRSRSEARRWERAAELLQTAPRG